MLLDGSGGPRLNFKSLGVILKTIPGMRWCAQLRVCLTIGLLKDDTQDLYVTVAKSNGLWGRGLQKECVRERGLRVGEVVIGEGTWGGAKE